MRGIDFVSRAALLLSAGLLLAGVVVAIVEFSTGTGGSCNSSGSHGLWLGFAIPLLAAGSFIAMAWAASRSLAVRTGSLMTIGCLAQVVVALLVVPVWINAVGPCLD